jgi:predicted phage-related endonuclease
MVDDSLPVLGSDVCREAFLEKAPWLKRKELVISASEVPSLFAAEIAQCEEPAPFMSEFELYARKIGALSDPVNETSRMRLGSRFEAGIADEYAQITKQRIVAPGPTAYTLFSNTRLPHLAATPDRFVLLPSGWGALEVKLTRSAWEQLPLRVQLQVQTQLAVLTMAEGRVAACVASEEVLPFEVPADAELAAMIVERVTLFWKRVEAREPPEPVAADREVVRKLWPRNAPGKQIALGEGYETALEFYELCCEREKAAKESKDTALAQITAQMQEAEIAVLPSGRRVQWKVEPRKGYEVKASEPRVFRVLANNKENK